MIDRAVLNDTSNQIFIERHALERRSIALDQGNEMKRKIAIGMLAGMVLGTAATFSAPAMAKDIVWARYGDIDTLDPHRATSTLSLQVWSLIYDTLLAVDKDGKPVPNLAESWSANAAGTEYTFKLHSGALCSDGTPLDANDVKYTVDRAFDKDNPSVTKASWGPIKSATVVDPLTVKLTLDKPFVALIPFLADSFSSIICDSNKGKDGFGTTTAIGSGPWKLVSWTKETRSFSPVTTTTRTSTSSPRTRGRPTWRAWSSAPFRSRRHAWLA